MPAFAAALQDMADKSEDLAVKFTIKLLLKHGLGRSKAIPLKDIVAYLRNNGVFVDTRHIQHKVLIPSRSNGGFIASGHGGIYIIETEEDAHYMAQWYRERIATETYHLAKLEALAHEKGWEI